MLLIIISNKGAMIFTIEPAPRANPRGKGTSQQVADAMLMARTIVTSYETTLGSVG